MRVLTMTFVLGFYLAPERGIPSPHVRGPHGLQSWTVRYKLPEENGGELEPGTLIIARGSHIVRRIEGDPFVWRWIFLQDGRQVALEEGPLHFSMTCVLIDVRSGRKLAAYDCYSDLPKDAPEWVKALEAAPSAP